MESSNASEIYLLLHKKFRVSRNIRVSWFLEHLNSPVLFSSPPSEDTEDKKEELGLEILSVINESGELLKENTCLLVPQTQVVFISSGYRFVFALDLSASVLRVDTFQQCVMVEAILLNLEECLTSLVQDLKVPGSSRYLTLNIFITIFAQWKNTTYCENMKSGGTHQKVVVQGCHLNKTSIPTILQAVKDFIYSIKYVEPCGSILNGHAQRNDDRLTMMIQTGLLALKLLPSNTSSGIVVFTDGVLGEPDPSSLDQVLNLCQNATTSCSFVHINPSSFPLCNLGCVSHPELMRFVAACTKGAYINSFESFMQTSPNTNFYQASLLFWSFQVCEDKKALEIKLPLEVQCGCSDFEIRNIVSSQAIMPTLISRKQGDKSLRVSLETVVGCRLREGYEIDQVSFPKNQICISLVLLWWKNHTHVQYKVSTSWPMSKNLCKVEVHVSGTYEFLRDISKAKSSDSERWTRARKLVVHRFLLFLQGLQHADHMLQYLASFNTDRDRYSVPDVLAQAHSIFHMTSNSMQFVLAAPEHTPSSFASYWKPILSLDMSIWQRWLHVHHIQIVMKHDVPLPTDLFSQSSEGIVHCKVAYDQLLAMLRKWCKFVLLEGHTYVQFVHEDTDDIPTYFFLVRLINKSPSMILKLAFFIGVPGTIRKQQIDELRKKIVSLGQQTNTKRTRHPSSRTSPIVRSHNLSDKHPQVVLMTKPLDNVLIQYSQIPRDYLHIEQVSEPKNRLKRGTRNVQSIGRQLRWYMPHKRYVWSLSNSSGIPLNLDTTSNLPRLLMRLRMAEGFHVAHSSNGIINLAREFPVKSNHDLDNVTSFVLVQCVLFPPTIKSPNDANNLNDSEEEAEDVEDLISEVSRKNLLAMEIWCEPQCGSIYQSKDTSNHNSGSFFHARHFSGEPVCIPRYEGLCYDQIASAISSYDSASISNIVTMEHLQLMCQSNVITFPQPDEVSMFKQSAQDISLSNDTLVSDDLSDKGSFEKLFSGSHGPVKSFEISENVTFYPCMFNLPDLLEHSHRIPHLFSTMEQDMKIDDGPNDVMLSNFQASIEKISNCEVNLSNADHHSITEHFMKVGLIHKPSDTDITDDLFESCRWSCFLKQGSIGQVFVIILPASYKDHCKLVKYSKKYAVNKDNILSAQSPDKHTDLSAKPHFPHPSFYSASLSDSLENAHKFRIARRISIKRQTSTTEESNSTSDKDDKSVESRTLAVYIYNCSMQILVSSSLQSVHESNEIKWPDTIHDHRFAANESVGKVDQCKNSSPSFGLHDEFKASSPLETPDDVFPLVSKQNEILNEFFKEITEAYKRSFVIGVYLDLQKKEKSTVGQDDLQIATDSICHEFIEEIDITNFMFLNSPQVMSFKSQNLTPGNLGKLARDADMDVNIEDLCKDLEDKEQANFYIESPARGTSSIPKELVLSKIGKERIEVGTTNDKRDNEVILLPTEDNDKAQDSSTPKEKQVEQNLDHGDEPQAVESGISDAKSLKIIPHRSSAFISVKPRKSKDVDVESLTTSSSEDERVETRKSRMAGRPRERKITQTLPIKQVNLNPNNNQFQSGWHNLPRFPISALSRIQARHLSGSIDQLEKFFQFNLGRYCSPTSVLPNVYFYLEKNGGGVASSKGTLSCQVDSDNDEIQFASKPTSAADVSDNPLFTFEKEATPIGDEDSLSVSDSGWEQSPLFLVMTCTVRDKSNGNHGDFPVCGLPIGLETVLNSFSQPCDDVDLSEIKITLDLIWLYLPSRSLAPVESRSEVPDCEVCSNPDVVRSDFPSDCISCIKSVKSSILWLLEDEIVSSLRTCETINVNTLERVCSHIKDKSSTNCEVKTVDLQFIFGLESSKKMFAQEFESLKLTRHKLKKEGEYYYLIIDKEMTGFLPIKFESADINFMPLNDPKLQSSYQMFEEQSSTPIPERDFMHGRTDMRYGRRSCASLYQQAGDMSYSKNLHKASSSVELSSTCNVATRSLSVSNFVPESGQKLHKQPKHQGNKLSSVPFQSSQVSGAVHQSLQSSLSYGKEACGQYNLLKDSSVSMPVTPVNYSNSEMQFNFSDTAKPAVDYSLKRQSHEVALSPMSDISNRHFSQSSLMASGYDGEVSDTEDDDIYMHSLQEANSQMPKFWLIVCLENDCAEIYFHRRGSSRITNLEKQEQRAIKANLIKNLLRAAKAVNQTLLLQRLHESRHCHRLLVEEEMENVWKTNDDFSFPVYQTAPLDDYGLSEDASGKSNYLAALMKYPQGFFECQHVYENQIFLHPRITNNSAGSAPSVMSTIRSFLKNFAVINQKNMFVFQMEDGTIYYCRMRAEMRKSESNSRRSSVMSSTTNLELIPANVQESKESLHSAVDNDSKLVISWYGVHFPPSKSNEEELIKVGESIQKKLCEVVLEYITTMLTRNQMFKLTPADVSLIQPRVIQTSSYLLAACDPDEVLSFQLSRTVLTKESLPAFLFYLHQNIQQFVIVPRYSEPNNPNGHFLSTKTTAGSDTSPGKPSVNVVVPNSIYLHIRSSEKGRIGHGIACIFLDVVCPVKDVPVSTKACDFSDAVSQTEVKQLELAEDGSDDCPKVFFYVWKRGSMQIADLKNNFGLAIRHSLCDLIAEHSLKIPLFEHKPDKSDAMRKLFDSPHSDQSQTLLETIQSKLSSVSSRSGTSTSTSSPHSKESRPSDDLGGIYSVFLIKWFTHMKSLECPSISQQTHQFMSHNCMTDFLHNTAKLLPAHLNDSKIFLFTKSPLEGPWRPKAVQENVKVGIQNNFLLLSRNFFLWKRSTGSQTDLQRGSVGIINKFQPHDVSLKQDTSPCPQHALVSSASYISRQHMMLAVTTDAKTVNFFFYNISGDRTNSLTKFLTQCASYHNARHNLLQAITFQKLGMFHRFTSPKKNAKRNDIAPYKVDVLARNPSLPSQDKLKPKSGNMFVERHFDEMYLDAKEIQTIDEQKVAQLGLPSLYGLQCISIAKFRYRSQEERMHLKNLFSKYQKMPSNLYVISTTTLSILKSSARHIHSQTAPVLFSRSGRQRFFSLLAKEKLKMRAHSGSKPDKEKLSRRSSFLETYRRRSGDSLGKLLSSPVENESVAEFDVKQLFSNFFDVYWQHWKGFSSLQIDYSKDEYQKGLNERYLIRITTGSIVLINMAYCIDEIVVRMYVVDIFQFPAEQSKWNPSKSSINFLNICERFKEQTDLGTFVLDLQVRELQNRIQNKPSVLTTLCPVVDILRSLMECYQGMVDFLTHHVIHGSIAAPCVNVSSQDLYSYLVERSHDFGLKQCFSGQATQQTVLCSSTPVSDFHRDDCSTDKHRSKNICVLVSNGKRSLQGTLELEYFILVSLRPLQVPESSSSSPQHFSEKTKHSRRFSEVAHSSIAKSVAKFQNLDLSSSLPEAFHSHEVGCFVRCEQERTEKFLSLISACAETDCYRRQLWHSLVACCKEKPASNLLTFEQFNTLCKLMSKKSAEDFDPKLFKLLCKRNAASKVRRLQKRLLKRFPKSSFSFSSADGSHTSVCVLASDTSESMITVTVSSNDTSVDYVTKHGEQTQDIEPNLKAVLGLVLNELCIDFWSSWW